LLVQEGRSRAKTRGVRFGRPSGPGVKWAKFSEGLHQEPPDLEELANERGAATIVLGDQERGFGVKLILFWAPTAEANLLSVKSVSTDISEVQRNTKNLAVQKIHDMTFVFSDGD
jgi:hypothetical protein